jgi:hypothetical protein
MSEEEIRPETDGDIAPGKLLAKGEVGFAYVAGLSSAGNPA